MSPPLTGQVALRSVLDAVAEGQHQAEILKHSLDLNPCLQP